MAYENKVLLKVKKDKKNWWYNFSKWNYRLQLCWDTRRDWFYIKQYAEKLWKPHFMKDLTEILDAMEADWNQPIFTLYELPKIINGEIN